MKGACLGTGWHWVAALEPDQAAVQHNLGYADDTTLMAKSEEELKSLLMKVKVESETVGLNHALIMWLIMH